MKKILLVIAFVLISGLIMANDWRVISDVKYLVMEYIVVGNIRTGEFKKIVFNQGNLESELIFDEAPTMPDSKSDSINAAILKNNLIQIAIMKKERCEIWEAIGDYQKNKK